MKLIKYAFFFYTLFIGNNINAQSGQSSFKSVKLVGVPKPMAPANLILSDLIFSDVKGNENNALDANETAVLSFDIENNGKGDAYRIKIFIQDSSNVKGVSFNSEVLIGNLAPGNKTNVVIPIKGTTDLVTSNTNFLIRVTEGNNFDPDPVAISFATKEYKKSIITIADAAFSSEDEAKITTGKIVRLTLLIQNQGEGDAKNLTVEFVNPTDVFASNDNKFQFSELKSNESKLIKYDFFANTKYKAIDIPIQVKVSENFNKVVLSETKSIGIEQNLAIVKKVNVLDVKDEKRVIVPVSLISDVDKDIPIAKSKFKNRYALIIGNEDYSTFQTGLAKEVNVDFAKNDAKIFKEYSQRTLGIPAENINLLINATYGAMMQAIDRINKLVKNSEGDLEIFFYYAGHGLPDEETKESYLIPVDISGANVKSAVKLQDVYKSFSEYESLGVTVFIDACFSGGARNQQMVNARGVKVVPRADYLQGNIVSFTASSSNQSSNAYVDKKHGLFTYFVLKALQDSKGDLSYKDLWESIKKKVSFESIRVNNKEQDPQINIGEKAKNSWEKSKFVY